MDLMEEMWISRPQRRMTKLSDLSDGSIARINYIVDYINNSHFRNELDIFTPEFDKKRTHHIISHKSDKDTLQVKVISNEGVIKSYDMSATGMSFEDMYEIIDKERNGYE